MAQGPCRPGCRALSRTGPLQGHRWEVAATGGAKAPEVKAPELSCRPEEAGPAGSCRPGSGAGGVRIHGCQPVSSNAAWLGHPRPASSGDTRIREIPASSPDRPLPGPSEGRCRKPKRVSSRVLLVLDSVTRICFSKRHGESRRKAPHGGRAQRDGAPRPHQAPGRTCLLRPQRVPHPRFVSRTDVARGGKWAESATCAQTTGFLQRVIKGRWPSDKTTRGNGAFLHVLSVHFTPNPVGGGESPGLGNTWCLHDSHPSPDSHHAGQCITRQSMRGMVLPCYWTG